LSESLKFQFRKRRERDDKVREKRCNTKAIRNLLELKMREDSEV